MAGFEGHGICRMEIFFAKEFHFSPSLPLMLINIGFDRMKHNPKAGDNKWLTLIQNARMCSEKNNSAFY
jgi:hypothetical protein